MKTKTEDGKNYHMVYKSINGKSKNPPKKIKESSLKNIIDGLQNNIAKRLIKNGN